MLGMIVRLVVIALVTLMCGGARADQAGALAPYKEGAKAYAAGEYFIALEKFRESYAQAESASTIYNIAQCLRQLGDHAEAVKAYKRYLELKPNASDAAKVRATIQKEEDLARAMAPPPPPPKPIVVAPPPPPPVVVAPPPPPAPQVTVDLTPPPQRSSEEHNARSGLIVGVTVGVLLVVGLSLGVGLGVGLSRGGPRSDLGTIRPEFN